MILRVDRVGGRARDDTFLRRSALSSFSLISASVSGFFFFFLVSSLASLGGGLLTSFSSDITSKLTVNAPRPICRCIRPSSCRVANSCFSSTRSVAGAAPAVHIQTYCVVDLIPTGIKLRNNFGQVVHTYVPLSLSSITWFWSKDGDGTNYVQ